MAGWPGEVSSRPPQIRAYEHRLVELSTVGTYAEFRFLLDGLPGWSGTDRLTDTADRDRALAAHAEAVAEGRVKPAEAPAMEAGIRHARRIRDLDAVLRALAQR